MKQAVQADEEPEAPVISVFPTADATAAPAKGRRRAYSAVRREMSEKEAASPIVSQFLVDEIERLESELSEYKEYRNKFHEADKKVSLLNEKLKSNSAFEIISTICVAVGGALGGLAPKMWETQPAGTIMAVSGFGLLVLGVVAKLVKS